MSDSPSSVPRVRRARSIAIAANEGAPVHLTFPSRFRYQFPPPDEEQFDVDQVAFAGQYFLAVFVLFIATAAFAAFVLVPLVGRVLSA